MNWLFLLIILTFTNLFFYRLFDVFYHVPVNSQPKESGEENGLNLDPTSIEVGLSFRDYMNPETSYHLLDDD